MASLTEQIKVKASETLITIKDLQREIIFVDDVLKIIDPVLAHLQNFPSDFRLRERHVILGMFREWKEGLDKLIGSTEPMVCIKLTDLKGRIEYIRSNPKMLEHDVCCVNCLEKGELMAYENLIKGDAPHFKDLPNNLPKVKPQKELKK